MNDGTETTNASAEVEQKQETTGAAEGATATVAETTTEETTEEPARTGAAGASPVAPSTGSVPPGTSNPNAVVIRRNAVVIRRMVSYVTADDDVSHGVPAAGLELAAIIAKVNDNGTVNLHCFAPDSAAALFKESVSFGTLAGQCHF